MPSISEQFASSAYHSYTWTQGPELTPAGRYDSPWTHVDRRYPRSRREEHTFPPPAHLDVARCVVEREVAQVALTRATSESMAIRAGLATGALLAVTFGGPTLLGGADPLAQAWGLVVLVATAIGCFIAASRLRAGKGLEHVALAQRIALYNVRLAELDLAARSSLPTSRPVEEIS